MRKLHHPSVLKVQTCSEGSKQVFFVAEPVSYTLLDDSSLSIDEIEYIADQMVTGLGFLHSRANLAHLGVSPASIVLTADLSVKFCCFNFASPIDPGTNRVFPKYKQWADSPLCPELNFSAPELSTNKEVSAACDVFSFGAVVMSLGLKRSLFACSTPFEMARAVSFRPVITPQYCSEPMVTLLKQCLSHLPSARPSLDEIRSSEAFRSIRLKTFQYFDAILTTDPTDRLCFFRGMLSSV
jgi:serine/threonine protein kinase